MKIFSFKSRYVKVVCACAIFSLMVFSTLAVSGQTTTFAQFTNGGGQDFVFTNNTTSGTFNSIGGGSPVTFNYSNISGLPPVLQGDQAARLFVTTTTTTPGTSFLGLSIQPLNQIVTVQIIRNTPAGVGGGSQTNLLTAVFTPAGDTPSIVGSTGGNSATLSASTPSHNVTFSSDFLSFFATTSRNLAFSFSSVSPALSLGPGNFLQNFTTAGTGTFASNPPPVYGVTAASVSVGGRVLTSSGIGLRNAEVVLTEANGTVHRARTKPFGNFDFSGISAGQTVVVSVNSKRHNFSSRAVALQEDVTELNFIAEN